MSKFSAIFGGAAAPAPAPAPQMKPRPKVQTKNKEDKDNTAQTEDSKRRAKSGRLSTMFGGSDKLGD